MPAIPATPATPTIPATPASSIVNADLRRGVAVVALAPEAGEQAVRQLVGRLRAAGIEASMYDVGPGVIMLSDVNGYQIADLIGGDAAVERIFMPDTRYRLTRREVWPSGTITRIGGVPIGGDGFTIIAGPCAVESRAQVLTIAREVERAGAAVLRGGGFKPRTSPYDFQGMGLPAIELLSEARRATGLPFITEVMDARHIEPMHALVDAYQVGARNMQNYELLKALSDLDKPVLLKRNPGSTVEEWLLAAEYLLAGGNDQVVLCERGIRTFNNATRYTLDLATVALMKRETHLPVIVDPSHGTGEPALIAPMSRAAMAAGADGVIIEVHTDPASAKSDGFQALLPDEFRELIASLAELAPVLGRHITPGPTRRAAASRV